MIITAAHHWYHCTNTCPDLGDLWIGAGAASVCTSLCDHDVVLVREGESGGCAAGGGDGSGRQVQWAAAAAARGGDGQQISQPISFHVIPR